MELDLTKMEWRRNSTHAAAYVCPDRTSTIIMRHDGTYDIHKHADVSADHPLWDQRYEQPKCGSWRGLDAIMAQALIYELFG